jgi:class 3 adenylate cyclase
MAFHSLRARLLVVQSALVVGLTIVTLAYVSYRANGAVGERFTGDLTRSRDAIASALDSRYQRVDLIAQVVASFPAMKSLLVETNTATIHEFLSDYRQQHTLGELLIALDATGKVLARSDTFAALAVPEMQQSWMAPALAGRPAAGEIHDQGRTYLCALVAGETGGTIFGFVMACSPVDDGFARTLKDVGDREIVILAPGAIAASTLPPALLPWRTAADVASISARDTHDINLDGEHFQAVLVTPREGSGLRIISLQSRDRALAPYRSIQVGLLVLGVLTAAAGIAGSAVLARSLAAPIGQLVDATRDVATGNLDVRLATDRTDEIGQLARAFRQMTEGLRERADMQKFMSQSTVDMIHNRPAVQRTGERRTLTLMFCDIRGFTSFADRCPPEEAVRVLNRYLHLQADLVKRFRGDVDKFMGDAVFAHFSGPDMALDAIRCAVEIQKAVEAASRLDPALPALSVGIGLATGDVTLGSIGSDDRLDYTAIGPAVNLASRLCSAAEAREILMSEATFALVRGLVAADAVPPLAVKGFGTPVAAYRMAMVAGV